MQEFTTTIKNLTKGLRPVNVPRDTGFLQDCLNLQPTAGDKLEQINYLQFPPVFIDTYTENRSPIAREDFFFLYQNETLDGNVLYNDADWNAETFSVVSVNGEAGNVGIELTLDDGGATCTIGANGALHFVPGPDYDLDVDESRTLTLTYEVSDGTDVTEGTVKIVVWGIYVEPTVNPEVPDPVLVIYHLVEDLDYYTVTGQDITAHGLVSLVDGELVQENGIMGNYWSVGEAGDFSFLGDGSTSWTVEWLMRPTSTAIEETGNIFLELQPDDGVHFDRFSIQFFRDYEHQGTYISAYVENSTGIAFDITPNFASAYADEHYPWTAGDEKHVALVYDKEADVQNVYIEGTFVCSFARMDGFVPLTPSVLSVGGSPISNNSYYGRIRGLKITPGVVYSAPFTPPTEF